MWNAPAINLSPRQKEILQQIASTRTARSDHRQRAELILLCEQGHSNIQAGRLAGMSRRQAGDWRRRWLENQDRLTTIESAQDVKPKDLLKAIEEVLSDLPRSGAKPTFTAEQIAHILAVACEDPQDSGLPLSHWTLTELQREVIKRDIVESISTSRLQVFLKSGGVKTS